MYKEYPRFKPDEVLEYLRKSRSDDPMLSVEEVLEKHETILKEWADKNLDAPIPVDNVYREVVSGETIEGRPEIRKLLKRIETPKIKAVLVVEVQRLSRGDLEDCGRLIKLLRFTNTMVITPQKIYDLNDEYDRDGFERELKRGNEYLEYTKKILQRGKALSLQSGNYINGVAPYGYTRGWVIDGKRKCPTLEIDENEAKIVRMIFDWYVNEGIGATKICQRLNAMGIEAKKGGLWKKSSIVNMLKNEHYIGKVVIRKHIKVNTVQNQEILTQCVFNEDFKVVDGKHPAIIDEETFYKANNKIHRYPSVKPSKTLQNPFASVLRCECGKVMIRRKNRNTYRYLCDEQTLCGNASVGEKELTEEIIDHLKQGLENLSAQVSNDSDNKKEKHTEYVSLLKAKYIETEKKELSLWDKYTEEKMPKSVFDTLMAKCIEEKQNLEKALETALNDVPVQKDYKSAIATLHEAITKLGDSSVSASAKNKLLLEVVDKIVYRRPKAIRMTPQQAKEKNVELAGGWYCPNFELDIDFKI